VLALLLAMVAGCSAKSFEYRPTTEIPEGPGMLSGEKGAFVLYSGRDAANAISNTREALKIPNGEHAMDLDVQEFQEFKRWKEANRDSPEYREFREWQEWKAFRAWKKSTR
jgi:hypothetical protein